MVKSDCPNVFIIWKKDLQANVIESFMENIEGFVEK